MDVDDGHDLVLSMTSVSSWTLSFFQAATCAMLDPPTLVSPQDPWSS